MLTINYKQLVAKDGVTVGKVVDGNLKKLQGRRCTAKGEFFDDSGKKIGQAEPIPEDERSNPEGAPFEDFEGATVQKNGDVVHNGEKVGEIVEGDAKKIAGKTVDADGVSAHPNDYRRKQFFIILAS